MEKNPSKKGITKGRGLEFYERRKKVAKDTGAVSAIYLRELDPHRGKKEDEGFFKFKGKGSPT